MFNFKLQLKSGQRVEGGLSSGEFCRNFWRTLAVSHSGKHSVHRYSAVDDHTVTDALYTTDVNDATESAVDPSWTYLLVFFVVVLVMCCVVVVGFSVVVALRCAHKYSKRQRRHVTNNGDGNVVVTCEIILSSRHT